MFQCNDRFYKGNILFDKMISIKYVKLFIDKIQESCKLDNQVGEINLFDVYIGDVKLFKDIINYIRKEKKFKCHVNLYTNDLTVFNDDVIHYCKTNHVNTVAYLTEYPTDIELVSRVDKVIFGIFDNTITITSAIYEGIAEHGCKNFDFNAVFFQPTVADFKGFMTEQFDNIVDYIISKFRDNTIPCVPQCIERLFFATLLNDEHNINHAGPYNLDNLAIHFHVNLRDTVTLAYQNELYLGLKYSGDFTSYCSDLKIGIVRDDKEDEIFEIKVSLDDIYLKYYGCKYIDAFRDAHVKSSAYDCEQCPLLHGCTAGIFGDNVQAQNQGCEATKMYCDYNLALFEAVKKLLVTMDNEKNELFKKYLHECYKRKFRPVI